jgi:hypothetical protein
MSDLLVFEYSREVDSYLSAYGRIKDGTHVLALLPEVQVKLKKAGVPYYTTCDFFDNKSHEELLIKSDGIITGLRGLVSIKDDYGVQEGYNNAFIFHARLFLHTILWLIETIDRACGETGASRVYSHSTVLTIDKKGASQAWKAGFAGLVCALLRQKGLESVTFGEPPSVFRGGDFMESAGRFLKKLVKKALFYYMYGRIRKVREGKKVVLFTSRLCNLGLVADDFGAYYGKAILPLYLYKEIKSAKDLFARKDLFAALYGMMPQSAGSDARADFKAAVGSVCGNVERYLVDTPGLMTYRGINFSESMTGFIHGWVKPMINDLYFESATLNAFLSMVKPDVVISQMSRGINYNLGELARKHGIPSVLISHGSHVPPTGDYERIEWKELGLGLIDTHYQYICVQSPWAQKYLHEIPSRRSTPIITGPPLYVRTDKKEKRARKEAVVPKHLDKVVLLHAGTPKQNFSRAYIFETIDEYIANINSLIRKVNEVGGIHLIVRFRPTPYLETETLRQLLIPSDCYSVRADGAFSDYLAVADMLVSYASTTIEEALYNGIPVLLYDPQGRHCHIKDARVLDPGLDASTDSCYFVKSEEALPWALKWLMDNHFGKNVPESLWQRHRYDKDETVSLPAYFRHVFQPVRTGLEREVGKNAFKT